MKPALFNYINDSSKTLQTGFIAQELYEVFPEVVSKGGDDVDQHPWAIDYSKLTPLLVKAVQEQQAQIEALKTEIEILKNKG